jgi:hypothetical protein
MGFSLLVGLKTSSRKTTTRLQTYTPLYRVFRCQKVRFCLFLTLFFFNIHSVQRCVRYVVSIRCRSRSDDRNQRYMQKKDSNFLLYENHSIMNTIRPESVCLG